LEKLAKIFKLSFKLSLKSKLSLQAKLSFKKNSSLAKILERFGMFLLSFTNDELEFFIIYDLLINKNMFCKISKIIYKLILFITNFI